MWGSVPPLQRSYLLLARFIFLWLWSWGLCFLTGYQRVLSYWSSQLQEVAILLHRVASSDVEAAVVHGSLDSLNPVLLYQPEETLHKEDRRLGQVYQLTFLQVTLSGPLMTWTQFSPRNPSIHSGMSRSRWMSTKAKTLGGETVCGPPPLSSHGNLIKLPYEDTQGE